MAWEVVFDEAFDTEFEALPTDVQDELYAQAEWIEQLGPKAGDKSGGSEKRFYKKFIDKADARYGRHLNTLKERKKP